MRLSLWILGLLFLVPQVVAAIPLDGVVNPRQTGRGWVSDQAQLLSASAETRLNAAIDQLERHNGCELAVVTIDDTDGRNPKEFSTALFNRWGIGKRGLNNGVLFLVVIGKRRVEIEVGDGARAVMPDSKTAQILAAEVVPQFKAGKMEAGIERGVRAVIRDLGGLTRPRPAPPPLKPLVDELHLLTQAEQDDLKERLSRWQSDYSVRAAVVFTRAKAPQRARAVLDKYLPENRAVVIVVTPGQVAWAAGPELQAALADFKPEWSSGPEADPERLRARLSVLWNGVESSLQSHPPQAPAPPQVPPPPAVTAASPFDPLTAVQGFTKMLAGLFILAAPFLVGLLVLAMLFKVDLGAARLGSLSLQNLALMILFGGSALVFPPLLFALLLYIPYYIMRYRNRFCPNCKIKMEKLSEAADDAHLSPGEIREEEIASVDYDVHVCRSCEYVSKGRWPAWLTSYSQCSSCSHKTMKCIRDVTISSATTYSEGRGERTYSCQYCRHGYSQIYTISRVQETSSSSSSNSSSGSSSFGGGSSSGGGSGASW